MTAYWVPEWFDTLAAANVASGFNGRTWLAIPLRELRIWVHSVLWHRQLTSLSFFPVWTKHARSYNDALFWRSGFSAGNNTIAGTGSKFYSNSGTPTAPRALKACVVALTSIVGLVLIS